MDDPTTTGATEGFGLMFYNARWYDPALGRFAQADTIMPGGAQGYDRYAYVNNSPVIYTDPSGHCTVSGHVFDDGSSQCQWASDSKPVRLTHKGDKVIVNGEVTYRNHGGDELYQKYLEYTAEGVCGWWNENCTKEFGLKEFIGMYLLFESSANYKNADVLVTVTAQNLYVGGSNPAYCPGGGICENAALNFIAANIDGNSGLLSGPEANENWAIFTPKLGTPEEIYQKMSGFGRAALTSESVVSWDSNTGPSSWGNSDPWAEKLGNISSGTIDQTLSAQSVYYYVGNFIVYSMNQDSYWNR